MVGLCFWANRGTRCVSNGERRGHLKDPVRRKLEDLVRVGVFDVVCCDDVVLVVGLDDVLFVLDVLPSVREVDILLAVVEFVAAGVAGKLGSCGVVGEDSVVGEHSSSSCRLADKNGS